MAYRKFKADFLFTGYEMLDENDVLITNDSGIIENIIPVGEAGDDIEILNGIITPGFVNCHCHLELSQMKGLIPEKTGLVDFLLSVIRKRNFSSDLIQQSINDAEKEMIGNGIVAVGDICNTTDTLSKKSQRNLYYHNFIETIGFPESVAENRFEASCKIFEQFERQCSLPVGSNSIVPHAPYSVSEKLFGLTTSFPANDILTIHNQETEDENEFFLSGNGDITRLYQSLGVDISFFKPPGKRSLANYLHCFHKNQSLILVHNVATNEEDLKAVNSWQLAVDFSGPESETINYKIQTPNLFFCLCPNANQYISGKLPDIDLLLRYNCKIVIGTDSLASNHALNILEELKTIQKSFRHIETKTLLRWATMNGAYSLQLDEMLGSFKKDKQPGIVLIENVNNGKLTAQSKARRIL